ncbi:MAG TPA: gamma carbonic anhydrase family protein, partial [Thermoanaerobaculia bacterium]|nr:gamma carbonic anhydrase family protein [Thermoanaerobaculia bacterium]
LLILRALRAPAAQCRRRANLPRLMIVRPYNGKKPRLGERVFVAENAALIGDVEIGNDCSIWFGTTIRGDVNLIRIGSRTNIQDNCTVHVTHDRWPTIIAEEVTIGHGAIVHGCTIHRGALIGMGSRVLDGAVVGESALVGAGALVPEGMHVPPRTLVVGVPAKVKRPLTDDELARLEQSWKNYVEYKENYLLEARGMRHEG